MRAVIGFASGTYGPARIVKHTIGCVIENPPLIALERLSHGCPTVGLSAECVDINAVTSNGGIDGPVVSVIFRLDENSSPNTVEELGSRLRALRQWLANVCKVTEPREISFPSRVSLCLYMEGAVL